MNFYQIDDWGTTKSGYRPSSIFKYAQKLILNIIFNYITFTSLVNPVLSVASGNSQSFNQI